jgi:hypothetical protein
MLRVLRASQVERGGGSNVGSQTTVKRFLGGAYERLVLGGLTRLFEPWKGLPLGVLLINPLQAI